MTENVLFFFSALGVFNAFLFVGYLVFGKPNRQLSDYVLAGILLCLVVRVGVSCFHFFGGVPTAVIKIGLVANLLLGPAVFFYLGAIKEAGRKIINQGLIHLGILLLCVSAAWFAFDFFTWDWKIRFIIHGILSTYLFATAIISATEIGQVVRNSSDAPTKLKNAVVIYLSVLLVCAGFAISLFTNYILGPLIFSLVFYTTCFILIRQAKSSKTSYQKKIDQTDFKRLNKRLLESMEERKLFRNPDLSLDELAQELNIGKHLLSQLLNDNLSQNFHQFINHYRVREASSLLKKNDHFSVEAIGYEVGFRSRSSFFAQFKKLKGITPAKYRKQGATPGPK